MTRRILEVRDAWPTRRATKGETWRKQCPNVVGRHERNVKGRAVMVDRQCQNYIPDEYDLCDHCLEVKYFDGLDKDTGGCCSCVESGYSSDQVVKAIRRALGQTVVTFR